jgi:hypothetical protein
VKFYYSLYRTQLPQLCVCHFPYRVQGDLLKGESVLCGPLASNSNISLFCLSIPRSFESASFLCKRNALSSLSAVFVVFMLIYLSSSDIISRAAILAIVALAFCFRAASSKFSTSDVKLIL